MNDTNVSMCVVTCVPKNTNCRCVVPDNGCRLDTLEWKAHLGKMDRGMIVKETLDSKPEGRRRIMGRPR